MFVPSLCPVRQLLIFFTHIKMADATVTEVENWQGCSLGLDIY